MFDSENNPKKKKIMFGFTKKRKEIYKKIYIFINKLIYMLQEK